MVDVGVTMSTLDDGTIEYRNAAGEKHRVGGPAVVFPDGEQWWYLHGKRHREDGPANVWADGTEEWYLHGKPHRDDGPSVIYSSGGAEWHLSGVILVAVTSRSEDFFLGDTFLSNLLNKEIVNELMSNKGFETKEEFGTWLALDVLGDDSIQVFTNNSFNRISMVPAVEEYLRNHEKYAGLPFSWWYPIVEKGEL